MGIEVKKSFEGCIYEENCRNYEISCAGGAERNALSDEVIKGVLHFFKGMAAVPHDSGCESELAQQLCEYFAASGFAPYADEAGNIICDVPASSGCEGAPVLCLQGHIDMVCAVREGSDYVPRRDSIKLRLDTEAETGKVILHSDGDSSLGADCGLGNAAALWALFNSEKHGPVRLILTVSEEIGLVGAGKMDESPFDDVTYIINVDGFAGGVFVGGSAGGRREDHVLARGTESSAGFAAGAAERAAKPAAAASPENAQQVREVAGTSEGAFSSAGRPEADSAALRSASALRISFEAFHGGHSGYDIDRGRANPVRLMAELLDDMRCSGAAFAVSYFNGGLKHNVIPGCAQSLIVYDNSSAEIISGCVKRMQERIKSEFSETDSEGHFSVSECPVPEKVLDEKSGNALIDFLILIHNGVYRHMDALPDVVDTSCNLGRVTADACGSDEKMRVQLFERSITLQYHDDVMNINEEAAQKTGFLLVDLEEYFPWTFNPSNPLMNAAAEEYERITGEKGVKTAVHVGLEPSVFGQKKAGMHMVNMGADVLDPHTIFERVYIDSVKPLALTLKALIERIAEEKR